MIQLTVDPDDLEDAVTDIRTSVKNLEASLDALGADMKVLEAAWTGDAADAFQARYRSWDSDMSLAIADLTVIGDLLYQASLSYQETEDAVIERCA
ncbi:WXG100 family type VII secretion target [Cellulomonas palmilytica]|uniref:WXG100 family type VII secretion target n=1 Tax=Cellulomonas palmilytica TaxID=2608402 RepID=UPI001F16CD35|nr:WXG100 family type VII secretion target [Cellulomonas palmilytica]UJP40353.1 WXG100 family type VII secretion target [Cellulomonas palmilytica]